jgi:hypothetical protein
MIAGIYTDIISVFRRPDPSAASRDVLNNPAYGVPTGWPIIYSNINARLQFSGKELVFAPTGELVLPEGVLYIDKQYPVQPMDHIVTVQTPGYPTGVEYVILSVVPAFYGNGLVDHYECRFQLATMI